MIKAPFQILCLMALCLGCSSFPPAAKLPVRTAPPDPLVMLDGTPVTSRQQWLNERRPELKRLFQHYEYGWLPKPADVKGQVAYVDRNFFGGKATLKLVTVTMGGIVPVHLMMVIPNHRTEPAPIFLGMNFAGNYTLVADPHVPMPTNWLPAKLPNSVNHQAVESGRGRLIDDWAIEQTIDRGYAVATYYCGDVEMDRTNAQGGVRELIQAPRHADDWGTIAAWAWGMQRLVDYLVSDRDIDAERIALVGHSRFGKATLLAGAFDERVALIIPLQAGCGGTAPSRGTIGESVKQINDRFPHWFCDVFKQFNGRPERLPFEQDSLIALCAPRPVLLGAAVDDTWANPAGAFEMLRRADGTYRLMGAEGLEAAAMPSVNHLIDSNLGYFIRPGKHSMTRGDWRMFLDFADRHLASH